MKVYVATSEGQKELNELGGVSQETFDSLEGRVDTIESEITTINSDISELSGQTGTNLSAISLINSKMLNTNRMLSMGGMI